MVRLAAALLAALPPLAASQEGGPGRPSSGWRRGRPGYPYLGDLAGAREVPSVVGLAAAPPGGVPEADLLSRLPRFPSSGHAAKNATDEHYPYADLISEAVSYCYSKLVVHPGCCIDEHYAPGVRSETVRRPGAEWQCDKESCWDDETGLRGYDVMWTPEDATCASPRVLFIHGGSWQYGSPKTLGYAQLGSKLAAAAGAVVMINDYPLNPIGNYSSILASSLEALSWLADHGPGSQACATPAPLFVAGDSAGGGTALSVVLELRRRGLDGPPFGRELAGAFFWSPWTNLKCNTPEYYFNAFASINDKREGAGYVGDIIFQGRPDQNLDWFTANAESYVGKNKSLLTDPIASPFHADRRYLAGLPPLYFAVGSSESILGDSVVVAQKAAVEGVDVHLDIHVGMWHVFPMYSEGCGSGRELKQAAQALNMTAEFIRRVSQTGRAPYKVVLEASPPSASGHAVSKMPYTMVNYDILDVAIMEGVGRAGGHEVPEAATASTIWLADASQVGSAVYPMAVGCLGTLAVQLAAGGLAAAWRRRSAWPRPAGLQPLLREGDLADPSVGC